MNMEDLTPETTDGLKCCQAALRWLELVPFGSQWSAKLYAIKKELGILIKLEEKCRKDLSAPATAPTTSKTETNSPAPDAEC